MEEKYKEITDIINNLATENPYITKAQVTKAKSMYNGDTRPLEVIRAELEAYSKAIMEQGLAAEADKMRFIDAQKKQEIAQSPEVQKPHKLPETPSLQEKLELPDDFQPIDIEYTNENKEKTYSNELENMLSDTQDERNHDLNQQNTYNQENKFIKKKNQEKTLSSSADAGYGNLTALLSLTIIFSIVTIILAFFTIISR